MSLRIVYGKSGTGKTEYILNEINEKSEKALLIVPEQFSFSAENKLLDKFEKGSIIKKEVLTLSRMAERVNFEVLGNQKNKLSKIGRNMIIYNILDTNKKKFKFLGNPDKNLDVVSRTITEFKKHDITIDTINNIEKTIDENKYLKLKLEEIKNILEIYQEKIEKNYIDESDSLSLLAQNLPKTKMFDDYSIYIDEFSGFTTQEYNIIEELLRKVKNVTISLCIDNLELDKTDEEDLFQFNKITASKLLKAAKRAKCKVEEPVFLIENKRIKSEEIKFLEENLYENKIYKKDVNDIKIFLAKSQYSEVEKCAKTIQKLVKNNGYKYRDIAVIANNIEEYDQNVNVIFRKYNIPIFIDEKKDINQNIFMRFVISLMNILSTNFSFDSMFSYLKLGLLDIDINDIFILENYCNKWGIRGSKWYKREFNYEPKNDVQDKIETLRKQIITPIMELKNSLSGVKTGKQITISLYNFIEENKIQEKILEKAKILENIGKIELSNEYKASITLFFNVLDEIMVSFENDKMSFDKFTKVLQIGLSESEFGKIPSTIDQVIFGDLDRSRTQEIKAMFVLGMNDGIIPEKARDEGFLNDNDRNILKEKQIELAKTTIETLYENRFSIYKAFSMPKEKIYFSYSASDKEGNSIRKSILITRLKKIFPKIKEESDIIKEEFEITNVDATFDSMIDEYRKIVNGDEKKNNIKEVLSWYKYNQNDRLKKVLSAISYNNNSKKIDETNIIKLYGKNIKASVSRLEQYQRCPFSFHLKYGLKLKEKEEFKIKSVDTGSFMHDVIDNFFERIEEEQINLKDITSEEIKKIVYQIIEEKLNMSQNYIFSSTPKFRFLTNQLKEVVLESIYYIVQQLKYSKFKIYGNEVEFKNGSKLKPIYMDLDNGKRLEIVGKIDRIDIAKTEKEQYVRIVDYKSSVKDIDLNQVVSGIQIQLLTYMDVITENSKLDPAGVLYFNLIDSIVKSNKNLTDDEIKKEIKKKFKMKGLIVADVDIVKMMDTNIEPGTYSEYLPIYLDKEGNISKSKSSVIEREKFEKLQRYVKKLIKEISKEIMNGKIDIRPFYLNKKKPCDYCEYKSICNFDAHLPGNTYNFINPNKTNQILEKIFSSEENI